MLGLGAGFYKLAGNNYYDYDRYYPSEDTSLLHWYRAGAGQNTSDDGVVSWNDEKGGNTLTGAGGASNQPIISNGGIAFDAPDDHLEFTSALTLGKFSIYFRALHTNSSAADFYITQADNGGTDFLKLASATSPRIKINNTRHDYTFDSSASIAENVKYTFGFERNAEGVVDIFAEQNGVNITSTPGAGDGTEDVGNTTDFREVGRPAKDLTIFEIVVFSDALTEVNRALLLNYLSTK